MTDVLERAFEAAGGPSKLARELGMSAQAVCNWRARGGAPIEYCAAIEKATNGAVTRRDLRPDDWQRIWPELAEPAKAAA